MKHPQSLSPVHALPMFDMQSKPKALPKAAAIGLKGPWSLNPGSPDFPNHRPFLTNVKAPNSLAPAPSQKLKTT